MHGLDLADMGALLLDSVANLTLQPAQQIQPNQDLCCPQSSGRHPGRKTGMSANIYHEKSLIHFLI